MLCGAFQFTSRVVDRPRMIDQFLATLATTTGTPFPDNFRRPNSSNFHPVAQLLYGRHQAVPTPAGFSNDQYWLDSQALSNVPIEVRENCETATSILFWNRSGDVPDGLRELKGC